MYNQVDATPSAYCSPTLAVSAAATTYGVICSNNAGLFSSEMEDEKVEDLACYDIGCVLCCCKSTAEIVCILKSLAGLHKNAVEW